MARRLGPYAPLSATYAADDAIIEAGEAAELLYVRGLAFCATSNSDGYITDAQLQRYVAVGMRDAVKRATRLVEVGLWTRPDGGYQIRSWTDWNATAEEMGRARKRDRERKRRKTVDVPPEPPPESRPPSDGIPDGIHAESEQSPDGVQTESNGIPSRAPTRTGAQTGAQPPMRAGHSTALNGTEQHGTSLHPPARAAPTAAGSTLLADHIAAYPNRPPRDVQRRTGDQIDQLLGEGIHPEAVRTALGLLRQRTNLGPSVLPSLVNEVLNPPARRGAAGALAALDAVDAHLADRRTQLRVIEGKPA